MKKLLSLLFITVAAMLPKSVWADAITINAPNPTITIDGTTLTINSTSAGSLKALMDKWKEDATKTEALKSMKACTTIKLENKFNASDLQSIQYSEGFTKVTDVDMAEAKFVNASSAGAPSQATYKLFNSVPADYSTVASRGTQGDRAIFGGTLYKSVQGLVWNNTGTPAEQSTIYSITNTSDFTGRSINDYGKIAKSPDHYLQMSVTAATMDGPHAQRTGQNIGSQDGNEANVIHIPGNPDEDWVLNLILTDENRPYGYMFGVRHYYSCSDGLWKKCEKSDWDNATEENRIQDVKDITDENLGKMEDGTGDGTNPQDGKVMSVVVYYVKTAEVRAWTNETTNVQDGATTASFDYAYRENHKSDFSNGEWVKMTDYDYYLLQGNGSWTWQQTTYTDGQEYYITKKYTSGTDMSSTQDGLPNADNQYAVVMGEEKYHNGTSWVNPDDVSETPHYADMKFDYWKETLQRATTSKYADDDINPEIFKECKVLTYVDFKAGVVKGFGDHKTTEGYASDFTIKIGKDVTKIDNGAFRRCDVLTEVQWDTYTDAEKSSSDYPKELVIDNEAFLMAKNLMSIKIPNRVTTIGDNAFEQVGTGATTDINNVSTNNYTFELIFERRNASDTDQGSVAINCNYPLTLGSKAFFDCWYLKDLSLPIRLESMGEDCFKNSVNLTTLTMREETNSTYTPAEGHHILRTIPGGAFEYSGVQQLTIPKSVTEIKNKAFGSTTGLTKVTFQNNTEYENPEATPKLGKQLFIESGAFSGGREEGRPQLDIYVMVNPNPTGEEAGRKMICEYGAFNYTQTVGQTSTIQNFATLHFPEEAWDYYQGDWKRGLAFRQDNLNSMKDGYTGDFGGDSSQGTCVGKGTAPIGEDGKYHKEGAEDRLVAPANGWQEFARTSTTIDIVIPNTGDFLRTYSTKTAKSIPLYADADTEHGIAAGDPFFKVYRISHFDDKYDGGSTATTTETPEATATEVKLHYDGVDHASNNYGNAYIPKQTGLLMVGYGSGSVSYIVYMKDVTEGANTTYPFTPTQYNNVENDVAGTTNLLFPSCEDDNKTTQGTENGVPYVYLNPTYPYPYASNTVPDFRFFGLAATSGTPKTYYFGRFVKNGKVTRDKAYLRLTNDVFHWKDGNINSGNADPNHSNASRVALNFFDDEEESGTTGIKHVDTTMQRMDSNVFYTLEGVKLNSRPTQRGIYIHNGRKVVIK